MAKKIVTSRQIRTQLRRAAAGEMPDWTVSLKPELSRPRIYDEATDFEGIGLEGWHGAYIIYAPRVPRGINTGPSRIVYIGKGWVDARGVAHLKQKPGMRRLARNVGLKFVAVSWNEMTSRDENSAWLCEQILLREHERRYGDLPKFNVQGSSSEVESWRRVIRWSNPGPVALLSRYGG